MQSAEAPVVFARWERLTLWLFQRTADFPRRLRYSLTSRIEVRTLDVYEDLVVARYDPMARGAALLRVSRGVDGIRLLVRLARDLGCLSLSQAEHVFTELDEVGRMVGGWIRSVG